MELCAVESTPAAAGEVPRLHHRRPPPPRPLGPRSAAPRAPPPPPALGRQRPRPSRRPEPAEGRARPPSQAPPALRSPRNSKSTCQLMHNTQAAMLIWGPGGWAPRGVLPADATSSASARLARCCASLGGWPAASTSACKQQPPPPPPPETQNTDNLRPTDALTNLNTLPCSAAPAGGALPRRRRHWPATCRSLQCRAAWLRWDCRGTAGPAPPGNSKSRYQAHARHPGWSVNLEFRVTDRWCLRRPVLEPLYQAIDRSRRHPAIAAAAACAAAGSRRQGGRPRPQQVQARMTRGTNLMGQRELSGLQGQSALRHACST